MPGNLPSIHSKVFRVIFITVCLVSIGLGIILFRLEKEGDHLVKRKRQLRQQVHQLDKEVGTTRWYKSKTYLLEKENAQLVKTNKLYKAKIDLLEKENTGLFGKKGKPEKYYFEAKMKVRLGKDIGQSLGSLFEAVDTNGRVLFGAGFNDSYSTFIRDNNRVLTFFYKDFSNEDTEIEDIERPSEDLGLSLVTMQNDLVELKSLTKFNDGQWVDVDTLKPYIIYTQPINDKLLIFHQGRITYDDEVIYVEDPKYVGRQAFFFYDGRIFLRKESGKIYNYRWDPYSDKRIDTSNFTVSPLSHPKEIVYTFCIYKGSVFCGTNMGGLYKYFDGNWKEIYRVHDGQFYSMLTYYDKLLIGHYPSGHIFQYDGKQLYHLIDFPPKPAGAYSGNREVQTLAIYRGDLFAGLWPWGELWRYNRDATGWVYIGRMFNYPELTKVRVPYYNEVKKCMPQASCHDSCGQRVKNLVNYHDSLIIGTSNKHGKPFVSEYEFLSEQEIVQYGRVYRLKMNSSISAQIRWETGPTEFHFIFNENGISMYQDGKLMYSAKHESSVTVPPKVESVRFGEGVFGAFNGKILDSRVISK